MGVGGGAHKRQVTVTGLTPPAGGRSFWAGARWVVEVFDGWVDDREASLDEQTVLIS